MSESLLQRLLDAGHLPVDDDDAQYEKLASAAAAMRDILTKHPPYIVPAVLLGLDPDAPEDDPLLDVTEQALKTVWKTLRKRHTERPRTLLQAILLDACNAIGMADPRFAAIAWLTAVDSLPLFPRSPLHDVLAPAWRELGRITEEAALAPRLMRKTSDQTAPTLPPAQLPARTEAAPASDAYVTSILSATGPNGVRGLQGVNPHAPHPHSGQWSEAFATRMSALLVEVQEASARSLVPHLTSVTQALQAHVDAQMQAITAFLRDTVAAQAAFLDSSRVQQDTLWWSQALYSPSLRLSYRRLPPEVAAFAMAADLNALAPAPAPASAAHLLGETVARLPKASFGDIRQLHDILDVLVHHGAPLRQLAPSETISPGRQPLLVILEQAIHGAAVDLHARTGAAPDTDISLPALAMALFRAMQARTLVESV